MPARQFSAAVKTAISHVVADFQRNPERFWDERRYIYQPRMLLMYTRLLLLDI